MFVIYNSLKNYYFHDNGKYIVFNYEQEANSFLQAFLNYAMSQMAQDPFPAIEAMNTIMGSRIEPFDNLKNNNWILWSNCSNSERKKRNNNG